MPEASHPIVQSPEEGRGRPLRCKPTRCRRLRARAAAPTPGRQSARRRGVSLPGARQMMSDAFEAPLLSVFLMRGRRRPTRTMPTAPQQERNMEHTWRMARRRPRLSGAAGLTFASRDNLFLDQTTPRGQAHVWAPTIFTKTMRRAVPLPALARRFYKRRACWQRSL